MSDIKRAKPVRKSSNSSISSRASNVSFSEKVRRESTAKFDNFMKECRAAYLAVLSSTTEKITSIDELILGKNGFIYINSIYPMYYCFMYFHRLLSTLYPGYLIEQSGKA